jgi:hypothetical protein
MLVLKHRYDWSFDECEREVRGSLVYRAFCRIDGERVPDAMMVTVHDPRVIHGILAPLSLAYAGQSPGPAALEPPAAA